MRLRKRTALSDSRDTALRSQGKSSYICRTISRTTLRANPFFLSFCFASFISLLLILLPYIPAELRRDSLLPSGYDNNGRAGMFGSLLMRNAQADSS